MGDKSAKFLVPRGGSLGTKKKFKVQIGEFEWVGERHTIEPVTNFITDLESTARWVGFIVDDVSILGLRMAKGDGSNPKDVDSEGTLGEVIQHMGNRYLVAMLESNNSTSQPAFRKRNSTGHALRINTTTIPNVDQKVVALENRAARIRDKNDAVVLITNKWGVPICMNLANLSRFFNIARDELAKELDISSGLFKSTITQLGLKRWPSRTMLSLENAIRGLEFGFAKGGFGADVGELQRSLNLVRTTKDEFQHASVEKILRMVKTELVPSYVRQFLKRVRGLFEETRGLPSGRNSVMEVFAVERGSSEAAGGTAAADNTAAAASSPQSGLGRRRMARVAKRMPVGESSGRSAKRSKKESKRVVATEHKGDVDSGSEEDSEDSSDYQPGSDAPSSSDSSDSEQ